MQLQQSPVRSRSGRATEWGISAELRAAVDSALVDALLRSAPTLAGPAARVSSGGKPLRPAVTIAAAGPDRTTPDVLAPNVLAGATAVELLHWATLVHDDVI